MEEQTKNTSRMGEGARKQGLFIGPRPKSPVLSLPEEAWRLVKPYYDRVPEGSILRWTSCKATRQCRNLGHLPKEAFQECHINERSKEAEVEEGRGINTAVKKQETAAENLISWHTKTCRTGCVTHTAMCSRRGFIPQERQNWGKEVRKAVFSQGQTHWVLVKGFFSSKGYKPPGSQGQNSLHHRKCFQCYMDSEFWHLFPPSPDNSATQGGLRFLATSEI